VQRVLATNVPGGNRLSCAFRTTSKTTEFFIDESLMPPPVMYLRNRRTHSVFRDPHNDTAPASNPLVTVAPANNSDTKPFTFGLRSNNPFAPDQPRQETAATIPKHVKFGPPSGPPTTRASSSTTSANGSNTAVASSAPSTSNSNRVATLQTLVDRYGAPVERSVEEDVDGEESDKSSGSSEVFDILVGSMLGDNWILGRN
ncbi:hypothetical protein BDN70DRAFT_902374, partial [Pholiota conissans]